MPKATDAIVLCGGEGLRLRSVTGDAPKGMALVAGRPFLDLLLLQLQRHGFERAILAVGYQKEVIESHYGMAAFGISLTYSPETRPLGTGGAVRNALDLVTSDALLVMNGDSYTDVDLRAFVTAYRQAGADGSVVVVPEDGRADCGSVVLDAGGRVVTFAEKKVAPGERYINAGVYMMSRRLLDDIQTGTAVSLERDLLPRWLGHGSYITGIIHRGRCIDIGTPERYQSAQNLLAGAETNTAEPHSEGQI